MEQAANDGAGRAVDRDNGAALDRVSEALQEIEYGSILIKVHQGKVVAIETSTKLRLDA
jgi:hypothetical protein